MLADVITVIGHEDDDRPFGDARLLERVEHFADLCVQIGNVCVVAVTNLGDLFRRERDLVGRNAA